MIVHPRTVCAVMIGALLLSMPGHALARIKLITLPVRERVEIQLDHPNVTLVEEQRIVPLVQGENQIDFSWANTRIDPETIVFRVLGPADEDDADMQVNVLSVSYPPNENALVWQVSSNAAGAARVRISYVLGNLDKSFHYRAVAANDEQTLDLSQYIRVRNFANEAFGSTGIWAGFGDRMLRPIGLNETRQMLAEKYDDVPIRKTYTADLSSFGYIDQPKNKLRVPMHYVLTNDADHNLGQALLPFGKVRIFQDDGRGTTAFLGEDWGQATPIDDEMRLYLGVAQDITVVRTIERNEQTRIVGDLYKRDIVIKYEIENFKDQAVTLDVIETPSVIRRQMISTRNIDVQWELGDQTTFPGGLDEEESEYDKLVFHADLPARADDGKAAKQTFFIHLTFTNEW